MKEKKKNSKKLRSPGIEPGSTAWKATMLTITPATHLIYYQHNMTNYNIHYIRIIFI